VRHPGSRPARALETAPVKIRSNPEDQPRALLGFGPDEARRIWVDGIVEGNPPASEAALIELRSLLDDDDRCTKLLEA